MPTLLAILEKLPVVNTIDTISGLIQGLVATDNNILADLPKIVGNLNDVIDKIPKININFIELNGFVDAITNLFS